MMQHVTKQLYNNLLRRHYYDRHFNVLRKHRFFCTFLFISISYIRSRSVNKVARLKLTLLLVNVSANICNNKKIKIKRSNLLLKIFYIRDHLDLDILHFGSFYFCLITFANKKEIIIKSLFSRFFSGRTLICKLGGNHSGPTNSFRVRSRRNLKKSF